MQYKIRLKNGTIIGPHASEEVLSLFERGLITGEEHFQVYPLKSWKVASEINSLDYIFKDTNEDATFVRKLEDLLNDDKPERKQQKKEGIKKIFPKELNQVELKKLEEEKPKDITQTIVLKKDNRQKRSEHTRVTPLTMEYLEELKKEENQRRKELEKEKQNKVENPIINYEEDSTQMVNIKSLQKELAKEATRTESQLDEKEKDLDKIKKIEEEEVQALEKEKLKKEKSKKKMFNLVGLTIVALAIGYIFLLPSDREIARNKRVMVWPEIRYPIANEIEEIEKSEKHFNKAKKQLNKRSYLARVQAGKNLHVALKYNFSNKKVLSLLVRVYGELLEDDLKNKNGKSILYKLLELSEPMLYSSENVLIASGKLYKSIGKPQAGLKNIENYFLLKKGKLSSDLYNLYLNLLSDSGELVRAQEVFDKLFLIKNKTIVTYQTLFNYLWKSDRLLEAGTLINQALRQYPKSIEINLLKCRSLMQKGLFDELNKKLSFLKKTKLGERPSYWARFFKYMGFLAAYRNKNELAASLFAKSLELAESEDLRNTLSQINADDFDVNKSLALDLVLESKSLTLVNESEKLANESEWELAIVKGIEAVEVAPKFIKAKVNLAKIQLRRGLFGESINGLEKLFKKHPNNSTIALELMNVYVESYKLQKAQSLFLTISQNEKVFNHPDFEKNIAKYHYKKKSLILARDWLIKGIKRNPLDDSLYFELAKIYFENKKYKTAKSYLEKSIKIDPVNVNYRTFYASILYELDGVDTAIGYLRRLMDDFPDNPYILGEIGIYYYRSGQLKDFEDMRKVVASLPYPKRNFYDYLIRTSMLNKEYGDVLKYARELIIIEPGDIKTRMLLGKLHFERSEYDEAARQFSAVGNLLRNYPKVRYYVAKILLYTGEIKKALEQAKLEIKENPDQEDGYILLADIFMLQKNWNRADEYYKKAKAINPKSYESIIGLGTLKYKRNQMIEAEQLFRLAKRLNPKKPEVYRWLGDVYRSLSRSVDAVDSYELFLSLSANAEDRARVQAYINRIK